ncbi:MAG: signal recognition particle-docking protein FtsY [Hyphomicrobiaceae bacterium]
MSTEQPKRRGFLSRLFGERAAPKPPQPEPEVPPPSPMPPEPAPEPGPDLPAPTVEPPAPAPPEAPPVPEAVPPPQPPEEMAEALPAVVAEMAPELRSWFQKLRQGLTKTSSKLTDGIVGVFTKRKLDAATLEELEDLLIQSDLGIETTSRIAQRLKSERYAKGISSDEVRQVLAEVVADVLEPVAKPLIVDSTHKPHVILVVGVNGTGKTTTIGKLANRYRKEGLKVVLAAGDTFRAAAIEQLKIWGERTGSRVVSGAQGADSAGLAFDAFTVAREDAADVLLIDTAGRLQNKANLMAELEKVVRVLRKIDATAPHDVVLVLDATTGQNALNQVEVFTKIAGVTGLVMTKLDGTARGGILVAIAEKHKLPVHAIGVGEGTEDLQAFDAEEFAAAIAGA